MSYKILIADDEPEIRSLLRLYLENEKYEIIEAEDGQQALELLRSQQPALCILDIMMPKLDGYHVLQELRKESNIPVLILSAKDADLEKILGLNLGADDYLAKPFEMRELVARIRALLRRSSMSGMSETQHTTMHVPEEVAEIWKFGPWRINMAAHHLIDENDVAVALSANEFKLLKYFLMNPRRVLTRDMILDRMGSRSDTYDRSIDVQISRLRSKLRDSGRNASLIRTLRGDGYMLVVPVSKAED